MRKGRTVFYEKIYFYCFEYALSIASPFSVIADDKVNAVDLANEYGLSSEIIEFLQEHKVSLSISNSSSVKLVTSSSYEVSVSLNLTIRKEFRKITKNKPSFTSDDSLRKILSDIRR